MASQEHIFGLINAGRQKNRAAGIGMYALHQAAMRLADFRLGRTSGKTKDLVRFLLSHGARSWRSSQPVVRIRLKAFSPGGYPAVKIRL